MIYQLLVERYLEYIRKTFTEDDEFLVNRVQMTELLRHSLCIGMGITSKPANMRVSLSSTKCAKFMFKGIKTSNWTTDDKMGVLEASIKVLAQAIKGGSKNDGR